MATDDDSLVLEVRAITGYDDDILSDAEVERLLALAKREIEASKDNPNVDYYGNIQAERALFWLTGVFMKIRMGEIDGESFSISELKVDSGDSDNSMYLRNFWNHYHSIGDGRPRGHLKGQRSDREYDYDNSATFPP